MNDSSVDGRAVGRGAVAGFFASVKGMKHVLLGTWEHPDAVIVQGEVTYTRPDDSEVTLPFANIWRMQGELIDDYLIYIDITPL